MATVYLAVQEILERQVALKIMSPALADGEQFGQRFMREARIVSQLSHPNIVTVYDVGVHKQQYYLSMAYIEGPDLKQAYAALDFSAKINVVADIAKALEFAGGKGYVHRDIKPENIMLDRVHNRAVLMDFGIARAAESDASVTQTGAALGTPHYMSPEQAKGRVVDARSDLYSLGVVLFFLMTGRVPYQAESAVAIGIKHITEPVPVLTGALSALQPLLERLMAKQPEHRFQSASELLQALAKLNVPRLQKQIAADEKRQLRRGESAAPGDKPVSEKTVGRPLIDQPSPHVTVVPSHGAGWVRQWMVKHRASTVIASSGLMLLIVAGSWLARPMGQPKSAGVAVQEQPQKLPNSGTADTPGRFDILTRLENRVQDFGGVLSPSSTGLNEQSARQGLKRFTTREQDRRAKQDPPRITQLQIDAKELTQPVGDQAQVVGAGPVLYGILQYENLPTGTPALQAVLKTAGGRRPLLEVPVEVSGKAGYADFRFDHPRQRILPGDYQLLIKLNGNTLERLSFSVSNDA